MEELPTSKKLSTEEKACEQHYVENTEHKADARKSSNFGDKRAILY